MDDLLAAELAIFEQIDYVKSKSIVSIVDLEKYEDCLTTIANCIKDLKISRDNWKKKYKELKEMKDE